MFSQVIDSTHFFIKKEELTAPIEVLRDRLTVKSRFKDNEPIVTYKETDNLFGVPRHYVDVGAMAEEIIDARSFGQSVDFEFKATLRPRQVPLEKSFLDGLRDGHTGFILNAATGVGKCLGKGTPVLMYSGEVKNVEDIVVGDLLMGPDSTPRTVLSLARGREEMYKVTPIKGDPYVVNESHILSLKRTTYSAVSSGITRKKVVHPKGTIVNISVKDYMQTSATFKHLHKGWRTGVDFEERTAVEYKLDPYFLGLWLGDGTSRNSNITNASLDVLMYLYDMSVAEGLDMCPKKQPNRCTYYSLNAPSDGIRNKDVLRRSLKYYGLLQNKHIPHCYKVASRERRLELLAGIIDADGSLSSGGYNIIQKNKRLALDIAFVARSLGLAAYFKPCEKTCCNNGKVGTYYRVHISGDCSIIPCKVKSKIAPKRLQKKDVLVSGITVEPIGEGDYYGFEIDGDHLFLLGDFTVTHNTVLFLNYLAHLKTTALIVVPRSHIIQQWKERILEHTSITEDEIGIAQQNKCEYEGKKVVLGMLHSLAKDKYPEEFKKYFGVVCFDELHTVAANTFSTVVSLFPSRYRLGCSATLNRPDGMSPVFEWALGQHRIELKGTTDVVPRIIIKEYATSSTHHPYLKGLTDMKKRRGIIISMLAEDVVRNQLLASFVAQIEQSDRRTLVLSDRTEQLRILQTLLVHKHGYHINDVGIFEGKTKKTEKERVLSSCKIVLATYGVMNMAIDVPDLRGLVFGTPTSHAEQAVGRILRLCSDTKEPVVLDLVDTEFKECVRWSLVRQSMYRKNKAIIVS